MQEMQQTQLRTSRLLLITLCVVLAVIAADQYTKWLVFETVLHGPGGLSFGDWLGTARPWSSFEAQDPYHPVTLLPILNFVMVWNKGISFGMFDVNSLTLPVIFIGVSLAVSAALLVWMIVMRRAIITFATAMIIGGALGNAIDRLRFRAVADFIDFHIGDRHWPAFNVADSCIVIGAALLMADSLLTRHEKAAGIGTGDMKEVRK